MKTKQKLDEVRTLAVRLFKASENRKQQHPKYVWGYGPMRRFESLPSESVDVWDAVAMEAIKQLRKP